VPASNGARARAKPDPVKKRLKHLVEEGRSLRSSASDDPELKAWAIQVKTALVELLGEGHPYVEAYDEEAFKWSLAGTRVDGDFARSLLERISDDVSTGSLASLQVLAAAEVFRDLLEMANYLLVNGFFQPAASLVGAVLEDGLRRIAERRGVEFDRSKGLHALNHALTNAGVYSKLTHDRIQVWTTVRNKADHGEWDEFKKGDVEEMESGVRAFLGEYLA
jgi:hypothetical protein